MESALFVLGRQTVYRVSAPNCMTGSRFFRCLEDRQSLNPNGRLPWDDVHRYAQRDRARCGELASRSWL